MIITSKSLVFLHRALDVSVGRTTVGSKAGVTTIFSKNTDKYDLIK